MTLLRVTVYWPLALVLIGSTVVLGLGYQHLDSEFRFLTTGPSTGLLLPVHASSLFNNHFCKVQSPLDVKGFALYNFD
jgi:hypothetical protein